MVIKCLMVRNIAKWLSNVLWQTTDRYVPKSKWHVAKWLSNVWVWQTDDDTWYTAKWLSNILWTDTQPNRYQMFDRQQTDTTWPNVTQPNGYQMFDRQMTHHTQPNGYKMFDDGQTHSQMVIAWCLTDRHVAKWHAAKWLSNVWVWQTDDTSYTTKWLSNIWWTVVANHM